MRVAVIVAHPDDETLGCGGTIAKHVREGHRVHVLTFTDGVGARGTTDGAGERLQAFHRALWQMGAQGANASVLSADFPDQRLDVVPISVLARTVERCLQQHSPDVVYTHSLSDLNADHRRVAEAVQVACRPLSGRSPITVYACETPSSTEWGLTAFRPTHFVTIAATLETKLKALACYGPESPPFPHPRSAEAVRALATWRGATVGVPAAEAFELVRSVW